MAGCRTENMNVNFDHVDHAEYINPLLAKNNYFLDVKGGYLLTHLSHLPWVLLLTALAVIAATWVTYRLAYKQAIRGPLGCRRIGIQGRSNLDDEFEVKYSKGDPAGEGSTWKVKSLWIYPIKSCKGIEVEEQDVFEMGFKYDRQFSFATTGKPIGMTNETAADRYHLPWHMLSMRERAKMSQIQTELWLPDSTCPSYSPSLPAVQSQGVIRVKFPRASNWLVGNLRAVFTRVLGEHIAWISFDLPFVPTPEHLKIYSTHKMQIWKCNPEALNVGVHVPPELGEYLQIRKQDLTLFRVSNPRKTERNAPTEQELGYQVQTGFQDYYPVHIISLATLRTVQSWLPEGSPKLSARRYRPNIIVEGVPVDEEDTWNEVRIGEHDWVVACRCVRCKMPNVDLERGVASKRNEPLNTLQNRRDIDQGAGRKSGCLGLNVVGAKPIQHVKVGDVVSVQKRGPLVYINL